MKKVLVPGLAAGVVMLVASMVMGLVFSAVFPSMVAEYENTSLFRPWSDPLMFYIFIHPLIMGVLLSFVWQNIKDLVKSGVRFGLYLWVIFTVPGMLITLSSFQVSLLMIASWAISVLVQYLLAGLVLAYLDKH